MNNFSNLSRDQETRLRALLEFAQINGDGNISLTEGEFTGLNIRQKRILDLIIKDTEISEEVYDKRDPNPKHNPDPLIEPREGQYIVIFFTDNAYGFINNLAREREGMEPSLPKA